MKMPTYEPQIDRALSKGGVVTKKALGLTPQGCNVLACAGAVAQCVANPDPMQCIMNIAPNCAGCI